MSRILTEIRKSHAVNMADLATLIDLFCRDGAIVYVATATSVYPATVVAKVHADNPWIRVKGLGVPDEQWESIFAVFETTEEAMRHVLSSMGVSA